MCLSSLSDAPVFSFYSSCRSVCLICQIYDFNALGNRSGCSLCWESSSILEDKDRTFLEISSFKGRDSPLYITVSDEEILAVVSWHGDEFVDVYGPQGKGPEGWAWVLVLSEGVLILTAHFAITGERAVDWGELGNSELHAPWAFLRGHGLHSFTPAIPSLTGSHPGGREMWGCHCGSGEGERGRVWLKCWYWLPSVLQKVQRLLLALKNCSQNFFTQGEMNWWLFHIMLMKLVFSLGLSEWWAPGAPQTHQCNGFLFPSCICSSCHVENHGGVLNISLLSFCFLCKQIIQHPRVPFSMCLKKEGYSCWQYFNIYKAVCSLFGLLIGKI